VKLDDERQEITRHLTPKCEECSGSLDSDLRDELFENLETISVPRHEIHPVQRNTVGKTVDH
jgi:hypothetical protein